MALKAVARMSPARIILLSLLATIALGTLFLNHPACQVRPIAFLDILFSATSAACVTGLITVPLDHFTTLGHTVLLFLIQIGGLGILTLTLFLIALIVDLGMATQLVAGHVLNRDSWNDAKEILSFIILSTIFMESIGTLLLYIVLYIQNSIPNPLFTALFHSVSAFCDAGFSLINLEATNDTSSLFIIIITGLLTLIGGLGFITWQEIINRIYYRQDSRRSKLSLASKIILSVTPLIIIGGTFLFWFCERSNIFASWSTTDAFACSLFHIISFRSAGFSTLPVKQFTPATLLLLMLVGFIGSSPGSTGSGIKTTTLVILLALIRSTLSERPAVEIKGRQIPRDQVAKALTIIALATAWIIIMTFLLLIAQPTLSFLEGLFEVVSATATVGASLGVTPWLSSLGKCIIMMCMIAGRIGPLALALAFCKRATQKEFSYPEERIMIG